MIIWSLCFFFLNLERGGGIRETPYGVGGEGMVGVSTNLNWADYQEKNQP